MAAGESAAGENAAGENAAPGSALRVHRRLLLQLGAASLLLRLLLWLPVAAAGVPPLYDEAAYLQRAAAWRRVLGSLATFHRPTPETLATAYGEGRWPPLQPLVLSLAPVSDPAPARLLMVLLSALTTPLVFLLGLRLTGNPLAAKAAGALHLLLPAFLAYSHYLWSETTVIFLLAASLLAALAVPAATGRRRWKLAAASGALLGLAVLTRAAALPWLLVLPAWLAWRCRSQGGPRLAGLVLAAGLLVLAPWLVVLRLQEGRWVAVSTMGGYNLALGNNPWVPAGYGSAWGNETAKAQLHNELDRRSGVASGSLSDPTGAWKQAAGEFGRQQLLADPATTLARSLRRLQLLWAPEVFPLRHLLHATYPPVPQAAAAILLFLFPASYLALLLAAADGLWPPAGAPRMAGRGLLLLLLVAGTLPPLLTLGLPRLHLPLLVLLLPAAGSALARLAAGHHRPRPALIVLAAVLLLTTANAAPRLLPWLQPSGRYAPLMAGVDALLGTTTPCRDRLQLHRTSQQPTTLRLLTNGSHFDSPAGATEIRWPATAPDLEVTLTSQGSPPRLQLQAEGLSVELQPFSREAWQRWQPTGLPGVEFRWLGGGSGSPTGAAVK